MNPISVTIHPSQFPSALQADLLDSLRHRSIQHKFHYDSVKQASKWLALHEAYSPARRDPDCLAAYDLAFARASAEHGSLHVVGLGCGGGQKEAALLGMLAIRGRPMAFTPVDVSVALGIVSYQRVAELPNLTMFEPIICDLPRALDLGSLLQKSASESARLFTCFGLMPNFEPGELLPLLHSLLRPGDRLLLSANLAPGPDYAEGVQLVFGGYNNELTQDWLLTFLLDLGVEREDGVIQCKVADNPGPPALKRIQIDFEFNRPREIAVHGQRIRLASGERVRLFFSYRHTPGLVRTLLAAHSIAVLEQWITPAGDEGVFLCELHS